MSDPVLQCRGLAKRFTEGGLDVPVLQGVALQVQAGDTLAVVGPSGAGKSTLLHLLGGLDAPSAGHVLLMGRDLASLSAAEQGVWRNRHLGFVYQFHHLLPEFSALENVIIPQMIAGKSRQEATPRAVELLTRVGLAKRLDHRPGKLSGGEQQRVAIARALANEPKLILADEPTGNLDHHTAEDVFAMLRALVHDFGVAALIATHNLEIAARMDRVVTLRDGELVAG